jgi:hypothetical protein
MSKRKQNPYHAHPILGKRPDHEPTTEETVRIFSELFDLYRIPNPIKNEGDALDANNRLMFALAKEFVPALQPKGRPGVAPDWSTEEVMEVIEEYFWLKASSPSSSDREIFEKIADHQPHKSKGRTGNAIRLRLIKKPFATKNPMNALVVLPNHSTKGKARK